MNKDEQIKYIQDNYPLYSHHISKRELRHDFFSDIKIELQAYLLGFYAADGNINEKRKTFRIHLHNKDNELVNLYKDIISPNARTFTILPHKTTGRNKQIINASESYGVDIVSSKLCNDLVNLGYGYNKSYEELHLPKISNDLIRHFIRGYFDGDGSFVASVSKPKNKPNKIIRMCFSILAKKPTILNDIIKFFSLNGIHSNINYIKRDELYRLTCSSKIECRKIYKLLYDDSNFYLQRKYLKFNYYANTEDATIIKCACNAQEMSANESNNSPKSSEHPTNQDENVR